MKTKWIHCRICGAPLNDKHVCYYGCVDHELDQLREENTELKEMVESLEEKNDKFMWQVRDTCRRAEKAETKNGELIEQRDRWLTSASQRQDELNTAEARVTELETQLAGRTYCHNDEAVEARLKKCEMMANEMAQTVEFFRDLDKPSCTLEWAFSRLSQLPGRLLKELNSEE